MKTKEIEHVKTNILTDFQAEKIIPYLLLNSSFISNLGLFHGKMGIALFFAHYGRHTENLLYDDFAGELLEEISEDLSTDLGIDLEDGLCGIGWGIEYLVQHGFMKGNTDKILEDIDSRVMEHDPIRVPDLSFRRGLAGIAFYVIARLSTFRENRTIPFDRIYLNNLKEALLKANFSEMDEIPPLLVQTYLCALDGLKLEKLKLPVIQITAKSEFFDNLLSMPLGLENGIAGQLLDLIFSQDYAQVIEKEDSLLFDKDQLFIFDEESRAATYGIGAYIRQLTEVVRGSKWAVTIVHLRSSDIETLYVEQKEEIQHIYIANIKNTGGLIDREKMDKLYYRNVLLLLRPYFKESKRLLFHLNYMHMAELAVGLKAQLPQSEVIATVHYMEWSLELLGDRTKLRKMLDNPEKKEHTAICKSVAYESRFLSICDKVIAISQHSYESLRYIYGIPEVKLTQICFGLKDVFHPLSKSKQKTLRMKYGFSMKDKIVVFAGRIDTIKGMEVLAEAFVKLVKKHPELRLIVVGDGNYNNVLSKVSPYWSKVIFTGFLDKTMLYDFFSISDIGVLPSFHEEFGIVALEMMMMRLPLVVGRTTGLCELVVNGETGITVSLNSDNKSENGSSLKEAIEYLLNNHLLGKRFSNLGRERFLKIYNFDQFARHIMEYYNCDIAEAKL